MKKREKRREEEGGRRGRNERMKKREEEGRGGHTQSPRQHDVDGVLIGAETIYDTTERYGVEVGGGHVEHSFQHVVVDLVGLEGERRMPQKQNQNRGISSDNSVNHQRKNTGAREE
jgi:hypothetical protein